MNNDWMNLEIPWFAKCCRETLGPLLSPEGFSLPETAKGGRVVFRHGPSYISTNYHLEDAPNFSLMVNIGLTGMNTVIDSIGLWALISKDTPAHEYPSWTFSSEKELDALLLRIHKEVIMIYAMPLWNDTDSLSKAILDYGDAFYGRRVINTTPPKS